MKSLQPSVIFRSMRDQGLSPSVVMASGLALFTWAKLSLCGDLPKGAKIQRIWQDGSGVVEEALSNAIVAPSDPPLEDLLPLKSLTSATVVGLARIAWDVVQGSDQYKLPLEEILSLDEDPADRGDVLSSLAHASFDLFPSELIALMTALADVGRGDAVYTPWDVYAQFAVAASQQGAMPCIENPYRQNITHLIQFLSGIEVPVHHADPIVNPTTTASGELSQFDVTLACPPVGLRYDRNVSGQDRWGRFSEQTSSGTVLAIRHLLAKTKRRVVVLTPSTLLSGAGAEARLRADLVRQGMVEAVLAVPKGLLATTGVGTAILVLDPRGGHENIRFFDVADSPFFKATSKTRWRLVHPVALARRIQDKTLEPMKGESSRTRSEVLDVGTLQVSRHVGLAVVKDQMTRPQARLNDLVHIVRPLHPTLRRMQSTTDSTNLLYEVGALDLPEYGYIRSVQRLIELPESLLPQADPLHLQPLDIIVVVKGNAGRVGIVPDDVLQSSWPWIVGQSGIVLRMNATAPIDARTLFVFLRSSSGRAMLQNIVVGATTPLIQLRELLALIIQLPSSQERTRAADALEVEDKIQHQIDQLRNKQAAVAADLWMLP